MNHPPIVGTNVNAAAPVLFRRRIVGFCSCFSLAGIVATLALSDVHSQTAHEDLLQRAESRLRAIYDRDDFRPKSYRANWLPDSSGYTTLESVPDAKEQVRVRYDVASGQRTVLDSAPSEHPGKSRNLSPDGLISPTTHHP